MGRKCSSEVHTSRSKRRGRAWHLTRQRDGRGKWHEGGHVTILSTWQLCTCHDQDRQERRTRNIGAQVTCKRPKNSTKEGGKKGNRKKKARKRKRTVRRCGIFSSAWLSVSQYYHSLLCWLFVYLFVCLLVCLFIHFFLHAYKFF